MTFVILPNCANTSPAPGAMTGVTNGTVTGPNAIQVCQGTLDTVRFGFTASDVNGDSITLSYSGLPTGAIATITDNGSLNPSFSFKWSLSTMPVGNYTFYINFKDNGCPLSSNQTVAYTIQIVPFQGAFLTGGISGCKTTPNGKGWIIPQPPASGNYSFTWTNAGGQVVKTTSSSSAGDSLLNAVPGNYTVTVSSVNGCEKNFTVTVPAPAYQASFIVDTFACLQESVSFANTSSANLSNWQWSFGDNSTSSQYSPTHSYNQTGSFNVMLVAQAPNGCLDTTWKTMHISEVVVTASAKDSACEGEKIQLSASGATSYSWHPFNGLSCINCQNPVAILSAAATYTVVGTDIAGCTDSATVSIYVVPTGLAGSFGDTAICVGDTVQLRADNALSYHWSPPSYISDTTAQNPLVYPPGTMTYTFYGEYALGCRDSSFVTVSVVPKAVIYLDEAVTIYPGESYQMNPAGNALYFQWFPPLGLSNPNIANPIAQPPVNTRYFVEASTEWGCRVRDSIDVIVSLESVIDVPNAFTPGAAPNDILKPVRRGEATLKTFVIFNRWGQKVFESSNIDEGWDGTLKGHPQPMGAYVYYIEAYTNTGTKFYKQGNITLLR